MVNFNLVSTKVDSHSDNCTHQSSQYDQKILGYSKVSFDSNDSIQLDMPIPAEKLAAKDSLVSRGIFNSKKT